MCFLSTRSTVTAEWHFFLPEINICETLHIFLPEIALCVRQSDVMSATLTTALIKRQHGSCVYFWFGLILCQTTFIQFIWFGLQSVGWSRLSGLRSPSGFNMASMQKYTNNLITQVNFFFRNFGSRLSLHLWGRARHSVVSFLNNIIKGKFTPHPFLEGGIALLSLLNWFMVTN